MADGNLFFNRSSCGVLETAEIVAEAAHPGLCGLLGHHGKRWVWLSEPKAPDISPISPLHLTISPLTRWVWLSELKAFAMRAGAELASKP